MPLSRNLGTLTSWNPLGHSGPVTGLIYLFTFYVVEVKTRFDHSPDTATIYKTTIPSLTRKVTEGKNEVSLKPRVSADPNKISYVILTKHMTKILKNVDLDFSINIMQIV